MAKPRTLYDKIWDEHLVHEAPDGTCLLYIDRHLVHEVTSPQAFEGLRMAGRKVRAPEKTLAVVDHNVPTTDRSKGIDDPEVEDPDRTLAQNASDFGVEYYHERDQRQGIVHVVGPEQGFTLPGTTIVCGDSHTSTHGAFGALAHGIGTSEVEHVLATQTLIQQKAKNMRVRVDGKLPEGVTAKDIILAIIGEIGTAGGTGHVIEYCRRGDRRALHGRPHDDLQHVDRGRRPRRPDRAGREDLRLYQGPPARAQGRRFEMAQAHWGTLFSDRRRHVRQRDRARRRAPAAASSPGAPAPRTSSRSPAACRCRPRSPTRPSAPRRSRALDYMGLKGGEKITDITLDRVFIGSCTNGRIEDLRAVAKIVAGKQVNENVNAMIVPGSGLVKAQAEAEGLDKIFKAAGFEWREPGCSMCLAMNADKLAPGRALRLHLEPQFRGPAGPFGPHPSGVAAHGGGRGHRRTFRRHPRDALSTG